MCDLETWSLLVGVSTPLLIAVAEQPQYPKPMRTGLAVLVCLLVGVATVAADGELSLDRWSHSALLILVASWAAYGRFWKPTGVTAALEALTAYRRPPRHRRGRPAPPPRTGPGSPTGPPNPMPGA